MNLRPLKSVRVGGVLDDVKGAVLSPSTLLHLVPFVGWPSLFLDMFGPGWGLLGKGAEVATHAAPGLVQGESLSDALIADYGTRLKIAAGVMVGTALAAASAGASAAFGSGGAAALEEAEKRARAELGDALVDKLKAAALERADREINQAYAKVAADPGLQGEVARLAGKPLTLGDLDGSALSARAIANRFGVREDVAALALNGILHRRIYGVTPETYDPATGARIIPVANDRTDGKNSAWALVDLLNAQNTNADPGQIASIKADYDRALKAEASPPTATAAELDVEIATAKQRGAAPDYIRDLQTSRGRAQASEKRAQDDAAQTAARVEAARHGDFGLALPPDRPPAFGSAGRSLAVEVLTFAALTFPAWATWLWLRGRR